jgi:tripartite-type tricarboxylate transporter receptor subunit TctC
MKQHKLFLMGVLAVAAALISSVAHAQAPSFPTKPIRWVVVAPAGSSLDVIARAMQNKLKDVLGQAVVVENRPQAGGTLGTDLDIDKYVTEKTLDGLFLKLANEEKSIRQNPAARSTDLLKKVFGGK